MASRTILSLLLVVPAALLGGAAMSTGWALLWVPVGTLGVAAAVMLVRGRGSGVAQFPVAEIHAEGEGHIAYVRLTNLDTVDTFTARVLRVSLEDTLSESPPWPISWQGVASTEMRLHQQESHRLELGRVVPGAEDELPTLHFSRARVAGGSSEIAMPWPAGLEDALGDDLPGYADRRVRAEIEITSERTGGARLVQVRIGIVPPDWAVDVQLVSIDIAA